jgi:alpha-galactosidase
VDCIADHPYAISEIRMIRRAIDKTGRPMVLSLSPGPTSLSHAEEVAKLSNMWRISNDEWDIWDSKGKEFPQGVEDQFARFAAWEKYAGPGHWPDGDMLPWGELKPVAGWQQPRSTRLTKDEETTQITLWAMARSPLILGANLTMLDGATQALLTNKDVIAIDQTSAGSAQVLDQKPLIAWRSKLKDGRMALAVFNTGDGAIRVDRKLADFDAAFAGRHYSVDEVWSRTHVGDSVDRVGVDLRPHACVLYLLR